MSTEIKSYYQKIIDVHEHGMLVRGYHERSMGLNHEPGKYISNVKHYLVDALKHHDIYNPDSTYFVEMIKGVFSRKKLPVTFTLTYEFDTIDLKLKIHKMEAELKESKHTYIIDDNNPLKLPPASEVVRKLIEAETKRQVAMQPKKKGKYHKNR